MVWMPRVLRTAATIATLCLAAPPLAAQQADVVELSLDRMVEMALNSSFQVRQLNMSIDRTRASLRAQRARLRSRVDLELSAPDFQSISQPRWNSDLQREEIIHENSRRLEAELSIRQPVILFGFPTNGYLSLNNRMYRYTQLQEDGSHDLRYYNRYYVQYTQPFFQVNNLRNDLERAELDLEDTQLRSYGELVEIVDDISDDYFDLFEIAYDEAINRAHVENLNAAVQAATALAQIDSARAIDVNQIQVELANAREQVQQSASSFRLNAANIKTRLNMDPADSIVVEPSLAVEPVPVDLEQATRFAMELTPRMRQLNINLRESELNLENTKGRGGFRMDLSVSYGREMQDPAFREIWGDPTNTYTVDLNAYVPVWDWGQRAARIEAAQIGLEQTGLRREQVEQQIRSDVENQVRSVEEFQSRALNMQGNLQLAAELSFESLELYRSGSITAFDLLQSFRRELDTAGNLRDAYLGWRRALLRIQQLTFFDFELGVPVLERYGIDMNGAETDRP